MARKRMLDPSFWSDERIGECSIEERLLFMGLISNADDEGYGRANSKLLKSLIFPYDDFTTGQIESWLGHLAGSDMVILYQYEGQTYYKVKNFLKYQVINKPTKSILPTVETVGITIFDPATVALR